MRNDFLEMTLAMLALVVGAGCEELLPKVCGLGFPVLLAAAVCQACRSSLPVALLFAVAAGAVEDSLSALPPVASASFFLVAAALVRRLGLSGLGAVAVYPVYQLWLSVWVGGLNVFSRILLAVPIGIATSLAVFCALGLVRRKAAVDEQA